MCGIFGVTDSTYIGLTSTDRDALWGMYLLNSTRGEHSTSFIGIKAPKKGDREVDVHKALGHPYNLFRTKEGKAIWKALSGKYNAVIGHGRHATQGKINIQNAHPFTYKHITLVHNGTIRDRSGMEGLLDKHKVDHKGIDVDSELLTRCIATAGVEETLNAIPTGAYACLWYDASTGRINAIRNMQRPLSILRGVNQVWFASEGNFLEWLKNKHVVNGPVEHVPLHTLLSVDANGKDVDEEKIKVDLPVTKYVTGMNHIYSTPYESFDYADWSGTNAWNKRYISDQSAPKTSHKINRNSAISSFRAKYKEGDEIYFEPDEAMSRPIVVSNKGRFMYGTPIFANMTGVQIRYLAHEKDVAWLSMGECLRGIIERIEECDVYEAISGGYVWVKAHLRMGSVRHAQI